MCSGKSKYILFWGIVLLLSVTSCVERMEIDTGVMRPYVQCILSRSYDFQEVKILNIDDVEKVRIYEEGRDIPYEFHLEPDGVWRTGTLIPHRGKAYTLNVIRSGRQDMISASTTYPPEVHLRECSFTTLDTKDISSYPEGSVGNCLYENLRRSGLHDISEIYSEDQNLYYLYSPDDPDVESFWWIHYPDMSDISADNELIDGFNAYRRLQDGMVLHHRYLRFHNSTEYDNHRLSGYTYYLCARSPGYLNSRGLLISHEVLSMKFENLDEFRRTHFEPFEMPFLTTLFRAEKPDGSQEKLLCHNASRELDLYYQSVLKYVLLDRTDVLNNMYPEDSELYSNIVNGFGIFGAEDIRWSEVVTEKNLIFPDPEYGLWRPEKVNEKH